MYSEMCSRYIRHIRIKLSCQNIRNNLFNTNKLLKYNKHAWLIEFNINKNILFPKIAEKITFGT